MKQDTPFTPAAVIFDMDGLMLDTEGPMIPLWIEAGKSLGYIITPELVLRTIGIDAAGTRAIILEELGADFPVDRHFEEIHRLYAAETGRNGIALKPGLLSLLDCLSAKNVPRAVATSSRRRSALWKLDKAGIRERFDTLVCGDEVARGKPAPDIFLAAARKLGKLPSECVGFEDSPAGLRGLRAAGIRPVFIKDLIEPPEEVLAVVWRRFNNLKDAVVLFG